MIRLRRRDRSMDASALASAEYWLSWIAAAKLAAAFLVAVGVAMEFGSEWISRPFEETVKQAGAVQVAALARDAETARGEIAKANATAAAANERTEQLRLEEWQRRQPRRIADDKKDAFVAAI